MNYKTTRKTTEKQSPNAQFKTIGVWKKEKLKERLIKVRS
jgi:hypothetical protein